MKRAIRLTNKRLRSFPPVIDEHTHILIIGSMPGQASLQAQQYYAYAHNQFWPLLFDLFEQGRTPKDYTDKLRTLLKHHIGLWDALATCTRPGSLDAHIQQPLPNDFPALFRRYPHVHTLLFNGQAAARYFERFYKEQFPDKTRVVLPSTSPAHAALSYLQKRERWLEALQQALTKKLYAHARELL